MNKKIKKILNKKNKSKIVCLTAYSKNVASILPIYIYDENQIGFYFSRNLKTLGLLSILGVIIFSFFQLFWDSFNLFLDNLL